MCIRDSIRPFTATTAGISSALAKIALCEVFPPSSVTIPETFSGLIPAVIEGVRSFATVSYTHLDKAMSFATTAEVEDYMRKFVEKITG